MNQNAAPRPSFGRALAEASRKLSQLHRRALADFDTDFPTWMLLSLLKEKGTALPVDEVVAELDRRMDLTGPDTIVMLERAAAAGHITYDSTGSAVGVALTEAGSDHFARVYAHSRRVTDAPLEGVDPTVIDTALTVLLTLDERATAQLG